MLVVLGRFRVVHKAGRASSNGSSTSSCAAARSCSSTTATNITSAVIAVLGQELVLSSGQGVQFLFQVAFLLFEFLLLLEVFFGEVLLLP